jgi:hypothetical protein
MGEGVGGDSFLLFFAEQDEVPKSDSGLSILLALHLFDEEEGSLSFDNRRR